MRAYSVNNMLQNVCAYAAQIIPL